VSPVGEGTGPCGPGVLHYYKSDLLAALFNLIHANISDPRLLVIEHDGPEYTDGAKCWTTATCRVVSEIALPELSTEQRVHWALLCQRDVCLHKPWIEWADGWLSGADRSARAARAVGADGVVKADGVTWAAGWCGQRGR